MTEKEAKKKWCPFVRHDEGWNRANWPDGDILNLSHGEGRHACNCIASQCMAWRWQIRGYLENPPNGYCGLANKPEGEL